MVDCGCRCYAVVSVIVRNTCGRTTYLEGEEAGCDGASRGLWVSDTSLRSTAGLELTRGYGEGLA
jgi:hypothetical protein